MKKKMLAIDQNGILTNRHLPKRASLLFLVLALGGSLANSQVNYTCDPSVPASTCNYLKTTVAGYYSKTFSNATVYIYVTYGDAGLGQSSGGFFNPIPYSQYVAALAANTNQSPVQTAALSALNTYDAGPYGAGTVDVSSALARALGLPGSTRGVTSDGSTECTLPSNGCYDKIVTLSNHSDITFYYDDQGGTEPDGAYDFYTTVQHETDEALGTSSCIDTASSSQSAVDGRTGTVKTAIRTTAAATRADAKATLTDSCGAGLPSVVDLYRYSGAGSLILDSSLSTQPGAYFSYDGGVTNGADGVDGSGKKYNTLANTDDYADFVSGDDCSKAEAVQNATGCPGQDAGLNILNDGRGEINILNALGYNLVVPATPQLVTSNKKLIDFGNVVDPAASPKKDGLDLENDDTTGALIGAISVVGTYGDASQFTFATSNCYALDPGKKCHIDVYFNPDAPIISRATLLIPATTASGSSTISIPLTGAGVVDVSQ